MLQDWLGFVQGRRLKQANHMDREKHLQRTEKKEDRKEVRNGKTTGKYIKTEKGIWKESKGEEKNTQISQPVLWVWAFKTQIGEM